MNPNNFYCPYPNPRMAPYPRNANYPPPFPPMFFPNMHYSFPPQMYFPDPYFPHTSAISPNQFVSEQKNISVENQNISENANLDIHKNYFPKDAPDKSEAFKIPQPVFEKNEKNSKVEEVSKAPIPDETCNLEASDSAKIDIKDNNDKGSSETNNKEEEEEPKSNIKMKPVKITPIKAILNSSIPKPAVKKKRETVADAFKDEEVDEEDMPPEAKMRMKNIGKDTPIPSGPNSFYKSKLGFCNTARIFEKSLETAFEDSDKK